MKKVLFILIAILILLIGFVVLYETDVLHLKKYNVEVKNNKLYCGTVVGGGKYRSNDRYAIKAIPEDGCYLAYWDIGWRKYYSENIETTDRDITYTAVFTKGDSFAITSSANENNMLGDGIDKVENGIFKFNRNETEFIIEHMDEYDHVGYWYEGEDNGYKNEESNNYYIDKGASNTRLRQYKYHEGIDMIFIVFEDRDSYISYRSNPTWNNIYSLKDSGEIKSITSFVYLMPSSNPNSYFSKTVSKNLDSDHYFVSVPVFFVGINKEIIYRIGSQFFDDSISETHKVVIQRNIV